ncbi:hypothetical protein [Flavobacterium subsaxonicum]|uniref:hypothetical protein n=1 Tax=Flavobacterium subsaxonicum TaxID=426226 RepID=UPI000413F225|nr:hypothetical protein [Flavobacterium subsaxonicum]
MKNAKLLLGVFAAVAMLTSCGDDDNNSTSASIVGKWAYSKDGVSAQGQEMLLDYEHTEGCNKDYVEFTADGKYFDVEYPTGCVADTIYNETYVKDGNTLTTGIGTDAETVTIETLSNTELKIKSSYTESGVTVNYVTVFTKQ